MADGYFDAKAESFVKGYMLARIGSMVSYFISETEPDMNHGYADLYLEPCTQKTNHAYIIELKYLNANAADEDVAKARLLAIDQAKRYRTILRGLSYGKFQSPLKIGKGLK